MGPPTKHQHEESMRWRTTMLAKTSLEVVQKENRHGKAIQFILCASECRLRGMAGHFWCL
eukprot:4453664-Amphidinium_carterae.1